MKSRSSKELVIDEASKEALIDYAFELYKSINFYDMRKRMLKEVTNKLEHTSLKSIKEAIKIYAKAKDSRNPNRLPHLSYFVTVALRLDEESGQRPVDLPENKILWGKTI